ncbi:MAG: dienelactone hydrolase family protein [Alphaproteobacteria bacterium]|nr:dienelactone hydrolase family protein [Alphaproteobacteria bacterium]
MLTGPELKPRSGRKPKKLIILLHGLGADGNNLIDVAGMLNRFIPDTYFIAPNAPHPYYPGMAGYKWIESIQNVTEEELVSQLNEVEKTVNEFIDYQLERFGLTEADLALVGFSQGTIVSLHSLLRRKKPAALIVGFSGALFGPQLLKKEIKSKPPVVLIHGEEDDILPIQMMHDAYDALKANDVEVEKHGYPNLAHSIGQEGFELAVNRLKSKLGA